MGKYEQETYRVYFKEQTPELQIGELEFSELYWKALLENDKGASTDYSQNTASWD